MQAQGQSKWYGKLRPWARHRLRSHSFTCSICLLFLEPPSPAGRTEENTTGAPDPFNIVPRNIKLILRDLCQMLMHCCPTSPTSYFQYILHPTGLLFPGPVLLSGTINLNFGYQIKHEWMDINIPPFWCFLHYTGSSFKHISVAAVPAFWCVARRLSAGCWCQVHPCYVPWYGPVTSRNCSCDTPSCHVHGTNLATANKQLLSSDPMCTPITRPNAYLLCLGEHEHGSCGELLAL